MRRLLWKSILPAVLAISMLCSCAPAQRAALRGTAEIAAAYQQFEEGQEEKTDQEGGGLPLSGAVPNQVVVGTMPLANPTQEVSALSTAATEDRVIYSVSPSGSVSLAGGESLTVSAYVKDGATVRVKLDDQIATLSATSRMSGEYRLYQGTLKMPAAKSSSVSLGNLRVYAQWGSYNKAMNGAAVTVKGTSSSTGLRKGLLISSGSVKDDGVDEDEDSGESLPLKDSQGRRLAARVASDYAEVFPWEPFNDNSDPTCYPIPQGTVDYVVSGKLSFDFEDKTFYYYNLASGKRVYTEDVELFYTKDIGENRISSVTVEADEYATELRVDMKEKTPFSAELTPLNFQSSGGISSFWPSTFSITFDYTDSVPSLPSFEDSPLFSGASWSDGNDGSYTLDLSLRQTGVFFGVSSYYDGDELVFRFVNPPVIEEADNVYGYRLDGVKIFLDPGHDAVDPGAISYGNIVYESTLNRALAQKVKAELEEIGAEVELVDTSVGTVPMKDRVAQARDFQPHIYVSLHHNYSEGSSSTSGVEAYYFNPYSMELAYRITKRVGTYYNAKLYPSSSTSRNRGAKFGYMYVTRYMDFPAVLVECGYISNPTELTFLRRTSTRNNLARYITAGITDYFANNSGTFEGSGKTGGGKLSLGSSESSSSSSGKKLVLTKK